MIIFVAIPFSESGVEVIEIVCMEKHAEAIAQYFQNKCGDDDLFRFVPPIEEQINRMKSKNEKSSHTAHIVLEILEDFDDIIKSMKSDLKRIEKLRDKVKKVMVSSDG